MNTIPPATWWAFVHIDGRGIDAVPSKHRAVPFWEGLAKLAARYCRGWRRASVAPGHSALRSTAICAAEVWSRVETRAYRISAFFDIHAREIVAPEQQRGRPCHPWAADAT